MGHFGWFRSRSPIISVYQTGVRSAFEFRLYNLDATLICIYQLVDDATRFDVGTQCFPNPENSLDAVTMVRAAISEFGTPQELLSDNSSAFNQLRQGNIGALEAFLASKGCLAISGRPAHPQTQGKNERSHSTLLKYLRVHQPSTLDEAALRIEIFRNHYNTKRPHQGLPGHLGSVTKVR